MDDERQSVLVVDADTARRAEIASLLRKDGNQMRELDDPDHMNAVVGEERPALVLVGAEGAGEAIFEFCCDMHSVAGKPWTPVGADARYLLGIVKNVTAMTELEIFASTLYDMRVEARDFFLRKLAERRDAELASASVDETLAHCIDEALATPSELERTFWLHSLADVSALAGVSPRRR